MKEKSTLAFDVLLLLIALFGWFNVIDSLGILSTDGPRMPGWLLLYWAAVSVPLAVFVVSHKQHVMVWKWLFLAGVCVIAIETCQLLSVITSPTEDEGSLTVTSIAVVTSFYVATALMTYRTYIGWKPPVF